MITQPIPENDVLIGAALWLHSNGWRISQISMAGGQNIDQASHRLNLNSSFANAGICSDTIKFRRDGPDIEALKENHIFRIECKGLGDVSLQTIKNNFDRAVASAVSYYDPPAAFVLNLGLALPEKYIKLMRNKLPCFLREAISLWIFLYVDVHEMYVFSPTEEIPT